jgi:hypothetical protein
MINLSSEQIDRYLAIQIDSTMTVKGAGYASFMQWCLKKTNGLPAFNPIVSEITQVASGGILSKHLSPESKIDFLLKLEKAGVNLFN